MLIQPEKMDDVFAHALNLSILTAFHMTYKFTCWGGLFHIKGVPRFQDKAYQFASSCFCVSLPLSIILSY